MERSLEQRFWEKVEKRGENECWFWQGATLADKRYGQFFYNGRLVLAPRISYFIANGKFPPRGRVVMHSCDNGLCVNPTHLSVGTYFENYRDALIKGLVSYSHMNFEIAENMREMYKTGGYTQAEISKKFGVGS